MFYFTEATVLEVQQVLSSILKTLQNQYHPSTFVMELHLTSMTYALITLMVLKHKLKEQEFGLLVMHPEQYY